MGALEGARLKKGRDRDLFSAVISAPKSVVLFIQAAGMVAVAADQCTWAAIKNIAAHLAKTKAASCNIVA